MTPEEKYIRRLEHKIRQLESSKSYRITFPLRKGQEALRVLLRIPQALYQYLNPKFKENFNDNYYLASSNRPYGWWRRYPAFHYCLFNSSTERAAGVTGGGEGANNGNGKLSYSKYQSLDQKKPSVVLVTHSACRTGAPVLVLDLLNRFAKTHNVIVISIADGVLQPLFKEKATVYIGPIARGNLDYVLDEELRLLKEKSPPEFAIVNSIEATEVLGGLWHHDIPALHLVHEFATYTRPRGRFEKSACFSSEMIFSAELVRANAMETFPQISRLGNNILPQGVCALPEVASSEDERTRERSEIKVAFRPRGWPDDTIVVLGAGTVQLRKGLDLFVSCAKKVIGNNPGKKIRFVWIGSGFNPEEDLNFSCFIDEQIKCSALGDSFTMLNEVRELQCAYDSADIFFLSSRLDPLPLVAQDALFNRLPLVCFEGASGIPEHISGDPKASFGVVPYLDVAAAAEKIQTLSSDAALRKKVGEAGRSTATRLFDQAEYFLRLNQLGQKAAAAKNVEIQDRETILESGCFNVRFAYPSLTDDEDLALKYYTSAWRTGIHRRKPFPGFHPGIYADHHPLIARDPLAHFIGSGKPQGPWLMEVIHSANRPHGISNKELPKTALHLHLHYPEVAREIFARLKLSTFQPDLFISVTSEEGRRRVLKQVDEYQFSVMNIKVVPNRGRDISPLFSAFPEIFEGGYECVGHLHGKKSVHLDADFAKKWAKFLYENLLGGHDPMMWSVMNAMQEDPSIGLVFPDDPHVVGWDENHSLAANLAERMGMESPLSDSSINFPVGTMFWARCQALQPLLKLHLQWEDYPQEPLPHDGSILHAIERLLPVIVKQSGYRSVVTYKKETSR